MNEDKKNSFLTVDIRIRGKVYALRFTSLLKILIPVGALIIRHYLRTRGLL